MTPEHAAQRIAEALNGGEFKDGRWYTEEQRQAWIKAVTPVLMEAQAFGTGVMRVTVDGCKQVDLEDYFLTGSVD